MDIFNQIIEVKFHQDATCQCSKIPTIIHELTQSLVVIQAYVNGCTERMKDNTLNHEQIAMVLGKINHHTEKISDKIYSML